MSKIMLRIHRPDAYPACRIKERVYENEEEARKAIKEMDKEGIAKITVWEMKEKIEL